MLQIQLLTQALISFIQLTAAFGIPQGESCLIICHGLLAWPYQTAELGTHVIFLINIARAHHDSLDQEF